ncbi:hypothetical protein TPA0907_62900 [Micromonospora humidisoli]|nr:hypothetical protein TPA0907_62900 [Micromonospora sp. AKA109]
MSGMPVSHKYDSQAYRSTSDGTPRPGRFPIRWSVDGARSQGVRSSRGGDRGVARERGVDLRAEPKGCSEAAARGRDRDDSEVEEQDERPG